MIKLEECLAASVSSLFPVLFLISKRLELNIMHLNTEINALLNITPIY